MAGGSYPPDPAQRIWFTQVRRVILQVWPRTWITPGVGFLIVALPFGVEHQRLVKDVLIVEARRDWILRSKTGWQGRRERWGRDIRSQAARIAPLRPWRVAVPDHSHRTHA